MVLAVLATAHTAHADIYLDPEPDPAHATTLALEGTSLSLAAAGIGAVLSFGSHGEPARAVGTMVLGLSAASLIITPSLGHRYGTGNARTLGMLVRIGGYAVIGAGGAIEIRDLLHGLFCSDDSECSARNHRGFVVMGIGGATMLVGAIYDIATAQHDTEVAIRHHRAEIQLAPTALRTTDGHTVAGLGLGGRF
ncbi:MAG TPA: hypothetical protein VFK02_33735 [Kofleriaceae bacterium]|nr:hypothetical protein [Kofleriaceae bacterium]